MTTSDPPHGGIPALAASPDASIVDAQAAQSMAKEIERLANQFFAGPPGSGAPGPALNAASPIGAPMPAPPTAGALSPALSAMGPMLPPHLGPNAARMGAGGAAPSVALPPIPGAMHTMPLAATPLPKDTDLRGLPTQVSEQLGGPSVIALSSQNATAIDARPYFLDLAGAPSMNEGLAMPVASAREISPAPASPPATPGLAAPSISADPSKMAPVLPTSATHASPAFDARTPEVVPELGRPAGLFDGNAVKRDFPILHQRVHGRPLVWLDNAATTQKPRAVIERLSEFYERENSNVHRAAHTLAARATDAYEAAREKTRRFLNAPSSKEIVFLRGTTEAINLVAQSWGRRNVSEGDEIVVTWLEHHANIVPWQQLALEKGAKLRVAPVDDDGQILLDEYEKLLGPKTKIVSFAQVSNALGTIVPAQEMVAMARRHGARVLVDGAQAVSHMPVDVQALDCDFYVFSGHKVFAPTGIGALYGKPEVLEAMPPWQGGGNMISDVTFEKTTYQGPPARFEAGTGNIADAVGLGAAIDYVTSLGLANVGRYEHELLDYAEERLRRVPGLRRIGTAKERAGVISFVLDGIKTEEVGGLLDLEGIAVRSGHHCAQPILRRFGVEATVRASLAPYNTQEDIDALVAALLRLQSGHARI